MIAQRGKLGKSTEKKKKGMKLGKVAAKNEMGIQKKKREERRGTHVKKKN